MAIFSIEPQAVDALSFPTLEFPNDEIQDWPFPPVLSGGRYAMPLEGAQPCRVETRSGSLVEGELLGLDLRSQSVQFRTSAEGAGVRLMFARIRSVTLTHAIYLEESSSLERRQARADEASECEFDLDWQEPGHGACAGITAGFVENTDGLFLFPTRDDFVSCERVFIPRSAYRAFNAARVETAAPTTGGITNRANLLAAIAAQETAPVLRIGESLVDLGLLTRPQLDYALATQKSDVPLGEMLVSAGTISRPDLLTALAHKMGYPFVDLGRFPIEKTATDLLPYATASMLCSLPIAIDAGRLIVATDRPTSLARLRDIPAVAAYKISTVIAPAAQIREAIARLPHPDLWVGRAN